MFEHESRTLSASLRRATATYEWHAAHDNWQQALDAAKSAERIAAKLTQIAQSARRLEEYHAAGNGAA